MGITARLLTGLLTVVLAASALPPAHAGDMDSGMGGAPGECPATVIVAARGNDVLEPTAPVQYSAESDAVSNGWEGTNIQAFLKFAEQRHLAEHGESLLRDTPVLGLSREYHPADVPLPEITGETGLPDILPRTGEVVADAVEGLRRTLDVGIPGVRRGIEDYERATGCAPRYILIGYSLGATILAQQEGWLAEKGQLAGSFYFGTAHQAPGDPAAIGATANGGLLGRLPTNSLEAVHTPNRILYCLPDDFTCNVTQAAIQRAIDEGGQSPHVRYFLDPDTHSAEVADRFSSWLVQ